MEHWLEEKISEFIIVFRLIGKVAIASFLICIFLAILLLPWSS